MRHSFFHRGHHGFDEAMQFAGGRRGPRGFGPFGGFLGGFGPGGHGFRVGRKLGSGELQLVLLALLAERPSHGYELIKALEERSGGFYSPSPGMVYPALTYLEEVGYASVEAEGTKKLYSITQPGIDHLGRHRETADAILRQLEQIGARMGRVREAFSGEADDEGDEDARSGPAEVWSALRELKRALHERRRAGAKEARRVAEILKRAVAEIMGEDEWRS